MVVGDSPVALKFRLLSIAITVPSPNASPAEYTVPSTGLEVRLLLLLITVRYWFADGLAAVKLPAMELLVMVPKIREVG